MNSLIQPASRVYNLIDIKHQSQSWVDLTMSRHEEYKDERTTLLQKVFLLIAQLT